MLNPLLAISAGGLIGGSLAPNWARSRDKRAAANIGVIIGAGMGYAFFKGAQMRGMNRLALSGLGTPYGFEEGYKPTSWEEMESSTSQSRTMTDAEVATNQKAKKDAKDKERLMWAAGGLGILAILGIGVGVAKKAKGRG